MNIVLLSGGSGKRLWPLSNEVRSKQFIPIFPKEDGSCESMVQRIYRQILTANENANVTVATSKSQVSALHNQLGPDIGISIEPCRRDTFPAIALACAYLHDIQKVGEQEVVIICPVDPYVGQEYFAALKELENIVRRDKDLNLALMGIQPTYPSEKYGYIIPKTREKISEVIKFKEKPTVEAAQRYIRSGALWNGGVFAFRLGYMLQRAHELLGVSDYKHLYQKYDTLEKISFDYAVVEHEKRIEVLRFSGDWKDLGTWNTLTEAMEEDVAGDGILSSSCKNTQIINELDIPVLGMGLKDIIVAASPDGILVADKAECSYLKDYADVFSRQVMYAEKSWGTYKVIDIEEAGMTIKITLKAGQKMNYHSHEHRTEVWNVISGMGRTVIDGAEQEVAGGHVAVLPAGCRHMLIADTDMQVIEIQIGREISVHDKKKYEADKV